VFFFLFFLLALPVWMRGGTRPEMMGPVPWLALAVLAGLLFRPALKDRESLSVARMRVWHRLLSDPLLYVAVAFIGILVLQWLNGPREEIFDVPSWSWTFGPPPRADLPLFCIDRQEALEMLFWFVPFYAIILVIRNGLPRSQKVDLLKLLAANAALLALFGLVQHLSGTDRIFGVTPLRVYFFASFGYQNHAGAFFVLAAVLAAGLLLRSLLKKEWASDLAWLAPVLMLCLLGAVFSKSRAAIFMVGFLVVAGCGYGYYRVGKKYSTQNLAAVAVSLAAVVAVASYVVLVVPGNPVREELKGTTLEGVVARVESGDPLKGAAVSIWREHPLFGVGGWGFRHYLPHYVPLKNATAYMPGQANVHHDPLQFLVEFGLAGAGLLALTLLLLVLPALRAILKIGSPEPGDVRPRFLRIPPLGLALLVGPLLTLVHSLADLPFRSPAILWLWAAMLACAADLCERTEPRHRHRRHAEEPEPAGDDPDEIKEPA
jgi:hypothetical protein